VGALLRSNLFEQRDAVVLTSATLAADGSFRYVRDRLGLDDAREIVLGSPFNYREAALVYVVMDVPEPGRPGNTEGVAEALMALSVALGGRTLALFTSHGQLRAVYERLRGPFERHGLTLLGQGLDGSRARLLQTFKSTDRTVLLGTSSFWEGVDVVGEALSALVIAKLPFSVPSDPVFAARSETFDDPFREYALPQAILRFKQGFGRLIRSKSDRGVVAILDRRVRTKGYGAAFLRSLPPCRVVYGPLADLSRQAVAWLAR